MTPKEFKAWFDGFTEAMETAPDDKQWEKIRARVAEIDGNPVSYPVYVDRYWPSYPNYPWRYWSTCSGGALSGVGVVPLSYDSNLCGSSSIGMNRTSLNARSLSGGVYGDAEGTTIGPANFDSLSAMYAAGKADAASMAA